MHLVTVFMREELNRRTIFAQSRLRQIISVSYSPPVFILDEKNDRRINRQDKLWVSSIKTANVGEHKMKQKPPPSLPPKKKTRMKICEDQNARHFHTVDLGRGR